MAKMAVVVLWKDKRRRRRRRRKQWSKCKRAVYLR